MLTNCSLFNFSVCFPPEIKRVCIKMGTEKPRPDPFGHLQQIHPNMGIKFEEQLFAW